MCYDIVNNEYAIKCHSASTYLFKPCFWHRPYKGYTEIRGACCDIYKASRVYV